MTPLFFPLAGFCAGILAGYFSGNGWLGVIAVISGLTFYAWLLKKGSKDPIKSLTTLRWHPVWITLLFLGLGMIDQWVQSPDYEKGIELDEIKEYIAEIRHVSPYAEGDRLEAELKSAYDGHGKVFDFRNTGINIITDGLSCSAGDILRIKGKIAYNEPTRNRRLRTMDLIPKRKGIVFRGYAAYDSIECIGKRRTLRGTSEKIRDKLVAIVEKSGLERKTVGFVTAVATGDRTFLDVDSKEIFANSGMAHIIALSGLHVAIILGMTMLILFPFRIAGKKKLQIFVALVLLWVYAFLSGLSPSTVRSCIMVSFVYVAFEIERKNSSANALFASALLILIFNPPSLFDPGMQLSFVCVGSIICFVKGLNPVDGHNHNIRYRIIAAMLVTLCAFTGTWCITSVYFGKIPMLFIPANLLLVPLLPFYMWIIMVHLLLFACGIACEATSWILDNGLSYLEHMASFLSCNGSGVIEYTAPAIVCILWFMCMVTLGVYVWNGKRQWGIGAGICFAFTGLSIILMPKDPDGFIFQNHYADIRVTVYQDGKEYEIAMPRNAAGNLMTGRGEVFSSDCRGAIKAISDKLNRKYLGRRYLILGNAKGTVEIPAKEFGDRFDLILIHPTVNRSTEELILQISDSIGLKNVRSIRQEGPIEVFL